MPCFRELQTLFHCNVRSSEQIAGYTHHIFNSFNFVNHPHHGTDPAKYQVPTEGNGENNN